MMRLDQLCDRLEDRPRLRGVRRELQDDLKSEYEFAAPFLRPTGEEAPRYPCPHPSGPGCPRRVFVESDGSRRAVCGCTPKECCPVELTQNDVQILAFDNQQFARSLRQVLSIQAPAGTVEGDDDVVTLGTIKATSGKRLPVVLLMAPSSQAAEVFIGKIEHTYRQGAVLLTPTENLIDALTEGRILRSGCTWLVLADLLFVDSNGLNAKHKLVDVVAQRTASTVTQSDVVMRDRCIFSRENKVWTLSFEGKTVRLPNRVGMGYIAELLRRPHTAIEAVRLRGASIVEMQLVDRGIPLADPKSIRQAKSALQEIESELAQIPANDWSRRGSLQNEIANLKKYLVGVRDHRGQPREVGGTADRSRTAVTTAVNRARDYISELHPALGRHLRESIQTGTLLIYAPSEVPDWQF